MGSNRQMRKSVQLFHCLLSDVFSIKLIYFFLDRTVDTPGHGEYVVGGFNDGQKRYLATFLRMLSTSEVDNIDSKCMRFDAMTQKGEVRFTLKYMCLLDLRDEIGTNGDKKHAKRNS